MLTVTVNTVTVNIDLESRLLAALRAGTGRPDLAYAGAPSRLTGGFWAELLSFTLACPPAGWPRDLVARVMPDPQTARKESVVQAAVATAGFPTPAVRITGGADSALGRAFMVMDRAAGTPLLAGLDGPGALASALGRASRIPVVLASAMAALHAVDPGPVRDELAGLSGIAFTMPGMLTYLRDLAERSGRSDLVAAAGFLAGHRPPPDRDVICHGDLHPLNVLADAGEITVLDWSASMVGPPGYDLAFTTVLLAEPPLDVPGPIRPALRGMGRLLARRFVRQYEAHAGRAVGREDLRWHQAVVCLRMLSEVASWVDDGSIGERSGHPFLTSGHALAARLTAVTGVKVRPR